MEKMPVRMDSPFFFVNPRGKLSGKHYSHCVMRVLWHEACRKVGVEIEMYSGLKHSSCSQYVNEKGYSIDEVQMMTDHARRDNIKKFASVQIEAKRRLLEGKVADINGNMVKNSFDHRIQITPSTLIIR
jgi:hypothetical protein